MRLIDTWTGEFVNFVDLKRTPLYAILSHTWDKDGEQTYQDVAKIQEKYRHQPPPEDGPLSSRSDDRGLVPKIPSDTSEVPTTSEAHLVQSMSPESPHARESEAEASTKIHSSRAPPTTRRSIWDADSGLSDKVRRACEIARRDGYRYIWIDSCCINKDSSSELSEAINSMFNWYRAAHVCYAFLVDVPSDEDPRAKDSNFRESRWFKRGWTLQELVAPLFVVFLSKEWKGLGTKEGLAETIQEITSIDVEILTHKRALSDESVANRMGWASRRKTTRVEDEAYSLLGIFGITMSTLYGEGEYAFRRLQEEILRRIPDQSIFAWGSRNIRAFPEGSCERICLSIGDTMTLLASSPTDFAKEDNSIIPTTVDSIASLQLLVEEYTHTPYGLRTQLCLLPLQQLNPNFKISVVNNELTASRSWYLAILRAQKVTDPQGILGQLCYLRQSDKANVEFLYRTILLDQAYKSTSSLYELSPDVIACVDKLETCLKTVYFPHPKPSDSVSTRQLKGLQDYRFGIDQLSLTIPTEAQDALQAGGFTVSNIQGPTEHHRNSFSFTLLHAAFNIHILFRCAVSPSWFHVTDDIVMINACARILPPGNEGRVRTTHIQLSPPSDSTTWVARRSDRGLWDTSLPSRCLILTAGFRDEVTVSLSLGLDLTALFRYTLRVDGAPQISGEVNASFRPHSKDTQPDGLALRLPYKTLDFIVPGLTRRALEMKGFSAHLSLKPSLGDTPSHSLTLSTDTDVGKFAIVVKYLQQVHTTGDTVLARNGSNLYLASESESGSRCEGGPKMEKIDIVAQITLVSFDGGIETVQDGPHVMVWSDYSSSGWNPSLRDKTIVLTTSSGHSLTLQLRFDLAWLYEYYLHVDITPGPPALQPPDLSSVPTQISLYDEWSNLLLRWAHRGISLTLPAHVSRALQAQGFQVLFERLEGGGASGDSDHIHHLLTLSHSRAGFDIIIKYFHDLNTQYPEPDSDPNDPWVKKRYPLLLANPQLDSDPGLLAPTAKASVKRCRQKLTFKASIQMFDCRSAPSRHAVHTTTDVHWEERPKWGRAWTRHRDRRQDIILTLPTGRQLLVLRLGFYLVWYSEYCPTVEINPRTPRPPLWLEDSEGPPMPDYERDDDGMEYIRRQVLTQSTVPRIGQSAEAPDDNSEPLLADPRTLEESPVWIGELEEAGNWEVVERPRVGVRGRGGARRRDRALDAFSDAEPRRP